MKKILLFSIILITLAFFVSAQEEISIKQFLDLSTIDNTIAVMGDLSSDADAFFTINRIIYGNNLNSYAQNDNEIDALINTKNIIIIGGPCVNTRFWSQFSDETCEDWQYESGQSLVKTIKKDNQNILLISGTDREDTFTIIEKISNSPYLSIFQQSTLEFTEPTKSKYPSVCRTTTDYCQTLTIGAEIPFKSEGLEYEAKLESISEDRNTITLLINGEVNTLKRGEKVVVSGLELIFDNIDYDYATGKASKAILHSSKIVSAEYGFVELLGYTGEFERGENNLNGLYFIRFPEDNTIIKSILKQINIADQTVEIELDDKDYFLEKGDTITIDNVKLTLAGVENRKVAGRKFRVTAVFDYEKLD